MDKFRLAVAEAVRAGFSFDVWGQANGPISVRLGTPDITIYRQLEINLPTWCGLPTLWDDLALWVHSSAQSIVAAVKPALSVVDEIEEVAEETNAAN